MSLSMSLRCLPRTTLNPFVWRSICTSASKPHNSTSSASGTADQNIDINNNNNNNNTQSENDKKREKQTHESNTNLRERLCEATLNQVHQHGWTSLAIDAALNHLQLSPASASLLPAGIASVSHYLDSSCNTQLAKHLFSLQLEQQQKADKNEKEQQRQQQVNDTADKNSENTAEASLNEDKEKTILEQFELDEPPSRAAYAMQYRLSLLDPYHQFWYQAVALRPRIARQSLRNRLLLADEIAAFANYSSPNMAWYTDRMIVASIYQAAELYWLTDTSKNRKSTNDFIHTRLNDAHNVRTKLTSSFSRAMSLYDATTATASTLFRASRNSY